jgi:hypothetical protein
MKRLAKKIYLKVLPMQREKMGRIFFMYGYAHCRQRIYFLPITPFFRYSCYWFAACDNPIRPMESGLKMELVASDFLASQLNGYASRGLKPLMMTFYYLKGSLKLKKSGFFNRPFGTHGKVLYVDLADVYFW